MNSVWTLVGFVAAIVVLLILVFIAESAISAKASELQHRKFEKDLEEQILASTKGNLDDIIKNIIIEGMNDNNE